MKLLLAAIAVAVAALSWGYWHSQRYAYVNVRVEDYGLKTDKLLYGTPHGVTLTFLGPANEQLAIARSVEPLGYILAVHPKDEIGNCEHRGVGVAADQARTDYAKCYAQFSAWESQWAPLVRRADVVAGKCELRQLPVILSTSNPDWWLWWVPLPHVGGVPRRYFELVVKMDSRACVGVTS